MAIYYQPQEGEKFDEEYYVKKHLPFVKKTLPGIVRTYYAKGMPTPTETSLRLLESVLWSGKIWGYSNRTCRHQEFKKSELIILITAPAGQKWLLL